VLLFPLQRRVTHPTFRFALLTVLSRQQDLFNRLPNGEGVADLQHTRHRQAGPNTLIGVSRHGAGIVREEDATFLSCPFQHHGIVLSRKTHVLNANHIQFGMLLPQPAHDPIVEVLIR
jgi:hypothetical protein